MHVNYVEDNMTKQPELNENNWLRRFLLGGMGVLGVFSPSSDGVSKEPTPSTALQSWISDSRRKQGQVGYSIAELSQKPETTVLYAAHRSHRSHASHYSSTDGHRSHYSSYSTPQGTPSPTPRKETTPKQALPIKETTPKQVLPIIVTPKPKEDPNNISTKTSQKTVGTVKINDKLIIEAKTGIVKSIISPRVFILEDSTIVELAGTKQQVFSEVLDSSTYRASAMASLTKWISGKHVRISTLNGRNAYVFVFPNELECYCVNLEMIREGQLLVDGDSNICAYSVLIQAQKEAMSKKIGIWTKEAEKNETQK
jgi:hypothetical protein